MSDIEDAIAQLYKLPLDEFTPARNSLAKRVGRPTIKDLLKPNVAAWTVNQLYWHHRPLYERLVRASERLRAEHRKMLAGKSADVRGAEESHREAVRAAVDKARSMLTEAGQAVSDATMTAVSETLQSLPAGELPGQLARPLKPMGFEALSGAAIRPAAARTLRIVEKPEVVARREAEEAKQRAREEKERQRAEEKERREARGELARAEAALERAKAALERAEAAFEKSRAEFNEASKAHQRARLRARE